MEYGKVRANLRGGAREQQPMPVVECREVRTNLHVGTRCQLPMGTPSGGRAVCKPER